MVNLLKEREESERERESEREGEGGREMERERERERQTYINVYLLYGSQSTVVRDGGERKRSKLEVNDVLLVMAAAKLKQREMITRIEALCLEEGREGGREGGREIKSLQTIFSFLLTFLFFLQVSDLVTFPEVILVHDPLIASR